MPEIDELEGGQPKNYLRPCLLLLLSEGPAHGYELLERLPMLGIARPDPGGVYRTLRTFEREGMVRSMWEASGSGPARRIYTITPDGEDQLAGWAVVLRDTRDSVQTFLTRYDRRGSAARARRR